MIIFFMNGSYYGYTKLKNHLALHLNFIQTLLKKISDISYVLQLFTNNGSIKKWHEFKGEYNLHKKYFQWIQLIASIPER